MEQGTASEPVKGATLCASAETILELSWIHHGAGWHLGFYLLSLPHPLWAEAM